MEHTAQQNGTCALCLCHMGWEGTSNVPQEHPAQHCSITEWLRLLQRYSNFLNLKRSITAWLYLTWAYLCSWWKNISWGWFTLLLPLTQHRVEDDWAITSLLDACDAVSRCAQAAELQSQVFPACSETYWMHYDFFWSSWCSHTPEVG